MSLKEKIWNKFKPSGEGEKSPDNPDVRSTAIPANILAFRTITTLLAQIPRTTQLERIDYLEDQTTSKPDRQILRNAEREKLPSETPYPSIISPSEPHDLNQRSAGDYLSALHENW
jgi:hypothetical protein